MDWQPLIDAATAVRTHAHAPYSRFLVGAALLGANGKVYAGCNVENRSYGLCICAERSAIAQAVADGCTAIQAVAVVTETAPPAMPCGMCRETLNEFAAGGDMAVLVTNPQGERVETTLRALHPEPFVLPET